MNQQINLYPQLYQEAKPHTSSMAALALFTLTFAALVVYYGFSARQLQAARDELVTMDIQSQNVNNEIARLGRRAGTRVSAEQTTTKIEQTKKHINRQSSLLDQLQKAQKNRRKRFSHILKAFATQHVDGTWLTDVAINDAGKGIALAGKSLTPALVPKYIQRLSRDDAFMGVSFSELQLKRSKDEQAIVAFTLGSPQQLDNSTPDSVDENDKLGEAMMQEIISRATRSM